MGHDGRVGHDGRREQPVTERAISQIINSFHFAIPQLTHVGKEDPEAAYLLGESYSHGWGVPWNPAQAIQWYKRAAARKHEQAHVCLSNYLALWPASDKASKSLTLCEVDAARWFQKAANVCQNKNNITPRVEEPQCFLFRRTTSNLQNNKNNHHAARVEEPQYLFLIGRFLEPGVSARKGGAAKNVTEAMKFYQKAAANGHQMAFLRQQKIKQQIARERKKLLEHTRASFGLEYNYRGTTATKQQNHSNTAKTTTTTTTTSLAICGRALTKLLSQDPAGLSAAHLLLAASVSALLPLFDVQQGKSSSASCQESVVVAADRGWHCQRCRRSFNSQGQLKNHLNSKKHKRMVLGLFMPGGQAQQGARAQELKSHDDKM